MAFNEYLSMAIKNAKLSTRGAAKIGEVSVSYLSRIVRDPSVVPTVKFLDKLAPVLKVPFTELFYQAGLFVPSVSAKHSNHYVQLRVLGPIELTIKSYLSEYTEIIIDFFKREKTITDIDDISDLELIGITTEKLIKAQTEGSYSEINEDIINYLYDIFVGKGIESETKMAAASAFCKFTGANIDEIMFMFDLVPGHFYDKEYSLNFAEVLATFEDLISKAFSVFYQECAINDYPKNHNFNASFWYHFSLMKCAKDDDGVAEKQVYSEKQTSTEIYLNSGIIIHLLNMSCKSLSPQTTELTFTVPLNTIAASTLLPDIALFIEEKLKSIKVDKKD